MFGGKYIEFQSIKSFFRRIWHFLSISYLMYHNWRHWNRSILKINFKFLPNKKSHENSLEWNFIDFNRRCVIYLNVIEFLLQPILVYSIKFVWFLMTEKKSYWWHHQIKSKKHWCHCISLNNTAIHSKWFLINNDIFFFFFRQCQFLWQPLTK